MEDMKVYKLKRHRVGRNLYRAEGHRRRRQFGIPEYPTAAGTTMYDAAESPRTRSPGHRIISLSLNLAWP